MSRPHWGWLTEYTMGTTLREATAAEWRRTADVYNSRRSGCETGAWLDDEGRSVYVDGGPDPEVMIKDVQALRDEAGQAGDLGQVSICDKALEEGHPDAEWAECVRVILDNRMNSAT